MNNQTGLATAEQIAELRTLVSKKDIRRVGKVWIKPQPQGCGLVRCGLDWASRPMTWVEANDALIQLRILSRRVRKHQQQEQKHD